MRKPKLVAVEWRDSFSARGSWMSEEISVSLTKGGGQSAVTVGYVVKEDSKGIMLAQSYTDDAGEERQWGGLWFVPKGCVTKVRRVK